MIVVGATYKHTGKSRYLRSKYGSGDIELVALGTDKEIYGMPWHEAVHNFATTAYARRLREDNLSLHGEVYVVEVAGVEELVHENEIGDRIINLG